MSEKAAGDVFLKPGGGTIRGATGFTMANPFTGGDILLNGRWRTLHYDVGGLIIRRVDPLAGTGGENVPTL